MRAKTMAWNAALAIRDPPAGRERRTPGVNRKKSNAINADIIG